MSALLNAVEILGSQSALARACGVKQGHVWAWLYRAGGRAPLEHCPAIEAATGHRVRCEALRPDVAWKRNAAGQVIGYTVAVPPVVPMPSATPDKRVA